MRTRLRWPRYLAIAAGSVVGLALVGIAAGVIPRVVGPGGLETTSASETRQASSATAEGVEIELKGAIYSATETQVRASVSAPGRAEFTGSYRVSVPPQAIDGQGFVAGAATAHSMPGGDLVFTLPPIDVQGALGQVRLTVSRIKVFPPGQPPKEIDGTWAFALRLPPPDSLGAALRSERSNPATVQLADVGEVQVQFTRSRSETIVALVLPAGAEDLSDPILHSAGDSLRPISVESDGLRRIAHYRETPFGEDVTVELGAYSVRTAGSEQPLVIRAKAAFERAGKPVALWSEAPLSAEDVQSGDPGRVVSTRIVPTANVGETLIQVSVRGAWNQDGARTIAYDASGKQFRSLGHSIQYPREPGGGVSSGVTTFGLIYEDEAQLERITLELGAEYRVVDAPPPVTLTPVR